jgi:phage FluMu protein Com
MSELYLKSWCPECKTVNWVYWSRLENDDTAYYYDGIRCRNCGHGWLFDETEWKFEKAMECCEWEADEEDFECTEEQWREFLDAGVTPFGKTVAECIEEFADLETGKELP